MAISIDKHCMHWWKKNPPEKGADLCDNALEISTTVRSRHVLEHEAHTRCTSNCEVQAFWLVYFQPQMWMITYSARKQSSFIFTYHESGSMISIDSIQKSAISLTNTKKYITQALNNGTKSVCGLCVSVISLTLYGIWKINDSSLTPYLFSSP